MAAARPVFNAGFPQVRTIKFDILAGAALATFAAHTLKFNAPCKLKVVGIRLNVGLRGGTHVTSTVNVLKGASTLLAALFDVAALTPATPVDKEIADLTAAADPVAANSEMSVVVAESGGTSPTWADVTVQIDYVELGG